MAQTAEFFRLYGEALRELGMLRKEVEFLDVAIDRFESALQLEPTHAAALWGFAKVYAQKIFLLDHAEQGKPKYKKLAAKCKEYAEKAVVAPEQGRDELFQFAELLQTLAATTASTANYSLNTIALEQLEKLLVPVGSETEPHHAVLLTKGLCLMSMGTEKLEEGKKKDARVKLEAASTLIERALALFRAAKDEKEDSFLPKYLTSVCHFFF